MNVGEANPLAASMAIHLEEFALPTVNLKSISGAVFTFSNKLDGGE
jgi:hypothetical protein